jgi:nicotinamide mononucleotide transporter
LNFSEILQQFIEGMHATKWYEYVAVFFGIASVWFSRKENILVYPVGIINTILYVYISFEGSLFGEVAVQVYYTIMSIYGWILWTKKNSLQKTVIVITRSNKKEWVSHLLFFSVFFITFFTSLTYLKKEFAPDAIPLADAFASATAFTGMWLMAKKKVESWYWWIATNIASIPLFFVKQYVFTSVYYFILLIMAVWGLVEWTRRANNQSRLLSEQKVIV